MRILVTNDDGHNSPLLHSLVGQLKKQSWVTHLDVIVPATEQSWIAGAVNRRGIRNLRKKVYFDTEYHIIDGSPADCTSIGCSSLLTEKPDIVFSGINFGVNAGVCFYLSSGTIAGARQAALFDISGISCSAELSPEVFYLWHNRDFDALDAFRDYFSEIAETQVRIAGALIDKNIFSPDRSPRIDFASINTPSKITDQDFTITSLEPNRFNPIFTKVSDTEFEHKFQGFDTSRKSVKSESEMPTDIQTLSGGRNSVTLFNVNHHGEILMRKISRGEIELKKLLLRLCHDF